MSNEKLIGVEGGVLVSIPVKNCSRLSHWANLGNTNHVELKHRALEGGKNYGSNRKNTKG